jgi:hypothetical protein
MAKKSSANGAQRKRVAVKASAGAPSIHPTLYALIIGCDAYLPNSTPEGSYGSLQGCVRDCTRVEEFLKKRAGLTSANLVRLTSTAGPDGKPTEPRKIQPIYENIINGFRDLISRSKAGDHVYIHYSGHGGQCPTIVPRVKGKDANDETLVPIDVGSKSARYVRDVEIAKLLKEMADKKLIVTVVLDSCHSGGATRAVRRDNDPTGIRGVSFVDRTPRPTDSLVGDIAELEAVAQAGMATRGFASNEARAAGTVVVAACRSFELAREFMFDGGPRQGALTYWFLKLVALGDARLTFRTIFDQVVKRIHDQFPDQTPMLIGDADRAILAGFSAAADPAIPVTAVAGSTVTLGAGSAALVEVGTEYAIYPATATELSDPRGRTAAIRVTDVTASQATAEVIERFQSREVQAGDRAVPAGVPLRLVRKVDVLLPNGKPPTKGDMKLRAAAEALSRQSWVEPVRKPGEPADFVVTTDKKGLEFLICDASDVALEIRPSLAVSDDTAPKKIADRLVHLARFQAVQTLENPDPSSALREQIIVELLRTPVGFQRGQATDGFKPFPTGAVPRLKDKEWVVLSVTNNSGRPVNLTLLNLASDYSVSVIDLAGQRSFPLAASGPPFRLPLKTELPVGQKRSTDVIKVIATTDPPPSFELLELPPLDEPITRAGATRSSGPAGPLEALLAAAAADQPTTRALVTGAQPIAGWTVSQVKIEVG